MLDILEGDLTLLLTLKNGHRYQVAALKLIKASELEQEKPSCQWTKHGAVDARQLKKHFSVPYGPDLAKDPKYANLAASWGLEVHLEFYVAGGCYGLSF
jgi:hypothetical protein